MLPRRMAWPFADMTNRPRPLVGTGVRHPLWLVALRAPGAGVWVVLLLVLVGCTKAWAQPSMQAPEYQVKAAFLYKFLNYVEWPSRAFEGPESPLVIGVLGADAVAEELALLVTERTAQGHPVVARKMFAGESLAGVHVLFVGRADSVRVASLLASTRGLALLTVTESDEAFAHGSVINFVVVDNKVRFDVALGPAELGNVKISSRLLAVARKVHSGAS